MAPEILIRTYTDGDDSKTILSNGQFARPFSLIGGWTKLRIGLRWIMGNTGVNITASKLYIGLCSGGGTNDLILDTTTTNWCGVASTGDWIYEAAPNKLYRLISFRAAKRVGGTYTENATEIDSVNDIEIPADLTVQNRSMFFVEIEKGSPNYTFNVWYKTHVISIDDVPVATYLLQSEETTPSRSDYVYGVARTLAVDESTGTFDHLCIGWDRTSPSIELSDHDIKKLA